ncbi:MAG: hypothetical protein ABI894_02770 [Ilumatobacteraceae bacterium]
MGSGGICGAARPHGLRRQQRERGCVRCHDEHHVRAEGDDHHYDPRDHVDFQLDVDHDLDDDILDVDDDNRGSHVAEPRGGSV